jgi:hypothetical protein
LIISLGFTSGTISGILSTYLNSDVLSITIQFCDAALGAYIFDIDPPALKKAKSIFSNSNSSNASTVISSLPYLTFDPFEFWLATACILLTGNFLLSKILSNDSPTIPCSAYNSNIIFIFFIQHNCFNLSNTLSPISDVVTKSFEDKSLVK